MKVFLTIACAALFLFSYTMPAEALGFTKCECVVKYKPPRGVVKIWHRRVKTEWETRYHCQPCGAKIPYKVKVVTYRDRYSDGSTRTWKCVVEGSYTSLAPVK